MTEDKTRCAMNRKAVIIGKKKYRKNTFYEEP